MADGPRLLIFEEVAARLAQPADTGRHHWRTEPSMEDTAMTGQPEHVQTSHPHRKLGRLPNDGTKPRLLLKDYLRAAYKGQVPDVVDYSSAVATWPMYGNDQIGDCTAAAAGHAEQVWSTYGSGATVTVSDQDVLAFYEGSTGYDPRDPSTDQGGVMQDVLAFWRKTGLAGHRIEAFFEVDPADDDELRAALYLFGSVNIGMDFPDTAMDQFDRGQPWDVARRARSEGGHDVLLVAMTKGGNYVVVTWGRLQEVTPAFWAKYMAGRDGEAWGMAEQEWVSPSGSAANALTWEELNAAMEALTGQPGPFTGTTPDPTPSPTPAPDDASIYQQLRALLGPLDAWLRSRGY